MITLLVFAVLTIVPIAADDGAVALPPGLSSLVDDTVALVANTAEESGRMSVAVAVVPLTYNGQEVPLGRMFALAVSTRLSNLDGGIRVMAGTGMDSLESVDFAVAGEMFAAEGAIHVFVQLTRVADRVLSGGVERSLRLTAEIAALVGVDGVTVSGATDPYEPDSMDMPYEVGMEEVVTGRSIGGDGDEDWYKIAVGPLDGQTILYVYTTGDTDTYIELYGPDDPNALLAENDDAEDANAGLSVLLDGNEILWVKVRGYDYSVSGAYTLHTEAEPFAGDPLEPDNERSQANRLEVDGSPLDAMIIPGSDVDWYYFDLSQAPTADQILSVETLGSLDTVLDLYDDTGVQLLTNDDGGDGENGRIDAVLDQAGRYYVRVIHYDGSDQGDYQIHVELLQTQPDDYEPDNERMNAAEIATDGVDQVRNFTPADDIDWATFSLSAAQTVAVRTHGEVDTYIKLYDRLGNMIAEDDDSGGDYNALIERVLQAGTYYVRIHQVAGDSVFGAEYRITVNAY